ncbi:Nucleoporin AMO1 [Colletotrichum sidae]|uniref:Nucleoporin AMO1 n=1 Tax=Colletotrichum sidae TaxID=1347389 RepID=A0A4R8T8Q1_9PEZI|nr:Nucleoporin AMO1 [Colletotrichum sidae]
MVVCKFFEQGTCRYGQSCRFEHPSRAQSGNRFAAFGSNSGGTFNRGNDSPSYMLSKDTIEKDLVSEAPQWILSAYGPGKDAPEQLFGGPAREQSFEEMRLHHVIATASGNPQQALNQAQELYQQAQQQMKAAVDNLDGAIQFIVSAEQKHPNRIDICKQAAPNGTTGIFAVGKSVTSQNPFSSGSSSSAANPFSSGGSAFGSTPAAPTTGSAFGQASSLGQKPNPFGAPAFGQPAQPTSAFGQPSQPTSAFGQPSQPSSAFGQPPQPTSAFGAPASSTAAFGQSSQPSSAFGQPSQLGSGGSAFGQASALGQKPSPFGAPAPAFGQTSTPAATGSAFGQASALGQKPNPFGGSAAGPSSFGAAAAAGSTTAGNTVSPFGQAAQNTASPSPFGQPAQNAAQTGAFGQPSQTTTASPSAFGAPAAKPSPFGQPAQSASPSPFGQPAPAQTTTATTSAFGQPAQLGAASNPFGAKPSTPAAVSMDAQPTNTQVQQPATTTAPANPFGAPTPSAFGQPAALGAQANPFGAAPAQQAAPKPAAAPTPGAANGPYPPGSTRQHPPVSSYSSKDMTGRLLAWKGKPVVYQNNMPGIRGPNGWTRIWFPDGPPNYYKDTELPDESYDDKVKLQWASFTQTGAFEGGVMPEVPPKREFCLWDL